MHEKTYNSKLHVQMFFLFMNTWRSKHVENTKNRINIYPANVENMVSS